MGFFSKIKENLNHGGIDLQLLAPNGIRYTDQVSDIQLSVRNSGDEPRQVKRVDLRLMEDRPGTKQPDGTTSTTSHEISSVVSSEILAIGPHETKSINFQLPLKLAPSLSGVLSENMPGFVKTAAGVLDNMVAREEAAQHRTSHYYIEARANVDGIALDPVVRMDVSNLKPGPFGT